MPLYGQEYLENEDSVKLVSNIRKFRNPEIIQYFVILSYSYKENILYNSLDELVSKLEVLSSS